MSGISQRVVSNCSELVNLGFQLTELSINFPYSPRILSISLQITGVSSVNYSDAELESLTFLVEEIEGAVTNFLEAVETMQEQLSLLTGSTASPESIVNAGTTTTTV